MSAVPSQGQLVRQAGLEPACLSTLRSKRSVSAIPPLAHNLVLQDGFDPSASTIPKWRSAE